MSLRAGPDHPYFGVLPNQIENIRKECGFETTKQLDEAIDALDTWARKQNHFVVRNFDRDYLEAYLITAKGSLEKAKKRLDKRCTLRFLIPEFFNDIQIRTEFKALHSYYKHVPLPKPTADYYRIVMDKYDQEHIYNFNMLDYARYMHVVCEYNMYNEYVMGFEPVIDLQNLSITFDLISRLSPMIVQKLTVMMIEGYGARIKAIHFISQSKLIDTVVGLVKQGLSQKLASRLQIHNSYESLQKFIPKENLPKDYGGMERSMAELHELFYKDLCSDRNVRQLKIVNNFATDESKRVSCKFNEEYLGMPGSFRTLTVD